MNYDPHKIDLMLIDDDGDFRETVARRFVRRGFRVQEAAHGEQALQLADLRQFDVVVLDMVMPGMSGIQVLEQLKQKHPECEVIMLTGQGTIETAVQAMKLGAFDFLTKPFPLADLERLIEKAYERRHLRKENEQLKAVLGRSQPSTEIIGESPAMQEVMRLIERAGRTEKAILIQGESGTGKELVAQALQRASIRADKPMVVINCAALPETLLESELFGHEKGSFTGAIATKPGLFEVADGGTLFIDEIGELAGSLQAKLLRVLEDGSLRRIGSLKERRVDVRLLAATNRNMEAEVAEGRFREDLYYRINVMSLKLPPLREREGDVPLLVRKFLGKDWQITPEAMRALEAYHWPGNVRQLINAVERAQIMSDDHTIGIETLPREILAGSAVSPRPTYARPEGECLADVQRAHILEMLKRERGNKARTARALGVNRRSLYRLLEKYNIQLDDNGTPVDVSRSLTPSH
ncbi:MAG: sigma-54-dependent Fis family transcriptional regulator [Planctomycetota bacterium]|nr:MAG: sigma-54-dependent Fis family transcriptional regulator [Planctomycetota bacterium]